MPEPCIYTPNEKIGVIGGHRDMNLSHYDTVEEFLSLCHLDDLIEGVAVDEFDHNIVALVVLADGRVWYHYRASRDMAFNFDMLEEVGQPWRPIFEKIIDDHRLDIISFDTPQRPWVFDVALQGGTRVARGYPTALLQGVGVQNAPFGLNAGDPCGQVMQAVEARNQLIREGERLGFEQWGAGFGFGGWDISLGLGDTAINIDYAPSPEVTEPYRVDWGLDDPDGDADRPYRMFATSEAVMAFLAELYGTLDKT